MEITEFRKWLESLPPDSIAGTAIKPDKCPIANWISQKEGLMAYTDGGLIHRKKNELAESDNGEVLPRWAMLFVRTLDTNVTHNRQGDPIRNPSILDVTAGFALEILNKIESHIGALAKEGWAL